MAITINTLDSFFKNGKMYKKKYCETVMELTKSRMASVKCTILLQF